MQIFVEHLECASISDEHEGNTKTTQWAHSPWGATGTKVVKCDATESWTHRRANKLLWNPLEEQPLKQRASTFIFLLFILPNITLSLTFIVVDFTNALWKLVCFWTTTLFWWGHLLLPEFSYSSLLYQWSTFAQIPFFIHSFITQTLLCLLYTRHPFKSQVTESHL